jgi:hypothetical protein
MAIIGEELEDYVSKQINRRQSLHGSGVNTTFRSDNQLNVLNSTTSWIKLASGVSITEGNRLSKIGFTQTQVEENIGLNLAKNNILFGGTATLAEVKSRDFDKLQQRSGFLPRDAKSSYTYGSYGFSPMPGIESADVKALNRGSIKKATVKLKANNREQFEILDLLYMRLGYTVLLEWGNSLFIDNKYGQKTVLRATLVEEFFFTVESKGNYFTVLDKIEEKREYYSGNYDGMLGKVSNFNWSFNVDGSYDIELTIISLGDVIESIKTNLSVDKGTLEFLQETGKLTPTEIENEAPSEPDVLEDNKSANIISSMLYVWKFINNTPEPRGNKIFINPADGGEFGLASFLVPTQEGEVSSTIASDQVKYQFVATYISKQETEAAEKSDKQASEKRQEERESNPTSIYNKLS